MTPNKRLNITEIEDNISKLVTVNNKEKFIIEFLNNFAIPQTSITRANRKFQEGEPFTIKNKLYYFETEDDVVKGVDAIQQKIKGEKSKPRFIIANNFKNFAAFDTKTTATLNILFTELPQNADFFLPWNGIEKTDYQAESPADRKAAERFARLYDALAKDNPSTDEHTFNLFLIRILFLLFAEDTNIMKKSVFTNILKARTNDDGSNLNEIITAVFAVLDVPIDARSTKENWLLDLPYVNGKLFREKHTSLLFTRNSRKLLIEAGELLNWQEINPDILGSMIQSVASAENRHVTGMHYTSVPNIMKVIKPLFLDKVTNAFESLKERLEQGNEKNITEKTRNANRKDILNSLNVLHERISSIKFLDPASGSGNFLIIAYKEIRRLEIKIILLEQEIEQPDQMPMSSIRLDNFNGIEIDDFAHEVAKISLWIAEHQMNMEMEEAIPGTIAQLLPLKDAGNIIIGNSLRMDWDKVVPHTSEDEIYIMGNPPYLGAKLQSKQQKEDLAYALGGSINSNKVDYITGWFYKASKYVANTTNRVAFVTTNSISQGEQVSLIWPTLLKDVQIAFAYTSFKWGNNAKGNAGVTVTIIGLDSVNQSNQKWLYQDDNKKEVENISTYLTEGDDTVVYASNRSSISKFPKLVLGSKPLDNDNLILTAEEFPDVIKTYPELKPFIKRYVGAAEYIKGTYRYALWLNEEEYEKVKDNPFVSERIERVRAYRESAGTSARAMADRPWEFFTHLEFDNALTNHAEQSKEPMLSLLIPSTSSENRDYVPMGIVTDETVISSAAMAVYDAPMWLLGLLESRMHMVWLRSVGGKLKTDYRYSAGLVYNTFPIENLSTQRKNEMKRVMVEILELREYLGGTLAELYNKENMPEILRKKHEELDGIVDRAYQQRPFDSDEKRLDVLLNLYQKMTTKEG